MPAIHLTDLSRKSSNFILCQTGRVSGPQDLKSQVVPDGKLDECDLYKIEKEVNKRLKKKFNKIKLEQANAQN